MASETLVDLEDLEKSQPVEVKTEELRKPSGRKTNWRCLALIALYCVFKAIVKEWLYELDLEELQSHWAVQAFGRRHELRQEVSSTDKVEKLFL